MRNLHFMIKLKIEVSFCHNLFLNWKNLEIGPEWLMQKICEEKSFL